MNKKPEPKEEKPDPNKIPPEVLKDLERQMDLFEEEYSAGIDQFMRQKFGALKQGEGS